MKNIGIAKLLIAILITVKLVYGSTFIVSAFAFEYHWESNETPEGVESYTPVNPIHIELLGDLKQISHHSASLILKDKYNVYLEDDVEPAHAAALLNTFSAVANKYDTVSYWTVVDHHIHNDININIQGDVKEVEVSLSAFQYANPLLTKVDGVQGKVFSKRLHRAVLRFISDNGINTERINRILNERYGVSVKVHDYVELTRHTTGEHNGRFEPFKPEELVYLISILEEFPEGMRKTEGLKYIIRRKDGTFHPLYPDAPAVAWPSAGYIEFMEGAFKGSNIHYIYRLIAHEKSHFLWAYTFDDQLKQDWITLGEWKQNDDGNWYTEQDTQFVSAYAHDHNPDEDMAESISYYIIDPDKIRTHAPTKYEFIQQRVMHGNRYISIIREDLTFEVYNLWPDYVYANRIKSVDITVEGDPKEDKHVHIEIELHKIPDANNMDAASAAYGLLTAEDGLSRYMSFYPVDNSGNRVKSGYRLVTDFVFSKHVTHGYWFSGSLRIYDSSSNARYISPNHFGWKLFIDNPLADNKPPVYIPNTIEMEVSKVVNDKGEPYNLLHVKWKAYDNYDIRPGGAICTLNNKTDNNIYSLWLGGGNWDKTTGYAHTYKHIPEYCPSGEYEVVKIILQDSEGARDHSWVKWGQNAAGQKYYMRAHLSGAQCFLRVEVNGGQNYGADDVCDGEWHHLAVVFPEGSDSVQDHDLYVDGKLQTNAGNDKEMNTNNQAQIVNIGARLTGHAFLLGFIDELAIFSVDLSQKQIDAIQKNGLKGALSADPQGKLTTSWAMIKTY